VTPAQPLDHLLYPVDHVALDTESRRFNWDGICPGIAGSDRFLSEKMSASSACAQVKRVTKGAIALGMR